MDLDPYLKAFQQRIEPLERFIQLFSATLDQPRLHQLLGDRGFRYERPDVRHFCLLKAVRVVSGLNACLHLARTGYIQELNTLMRTVAESCSHIKYVANRAAPEVDRAEAQKWVEDYFADYRRDPFAEFKKKHIQQGRVHASLGKTLDDFSVEQGDVVEGRKPAAKMYSNVYASGSNYVHARYPEVMDLYGGRPGQFHLRGMRETPKASESLEVLETYLGDASLTFVSLIQGLDLHVIVRSDFILTRWYAGHFERGG